jgi:hypothetical protein
MTTRKLHEIRRLRRELKAANQRAAKYAAMATAAPLASAYLNLSVGALVSAIADAVRPKRATTTGGT